MKTQSRFFGPYGCYEKNTISLLNEKLLQCFKTDGRYQVFFFFFPKKKMSGNLQKTKVDRIATFSVRGKSAEKPKKMYIYTKVRIFRSFDISSPEIGRELDRKGDEVEILKVERRIFWNFCLLWPKEKNLEIDQKWWR